jgi:hypothetical protein
MWDFVGQICSVAEDLSCLRCDTVLLGELFLRF